MKRTSSKETGKEELVITRTFDAPLAMVWKAWTDSELVKRWWGPRYFTAPAITNDFRVGGHYLYGMKSPDGQVIWSTGTYQEITPFERIVATDSFADEHGNVVPASYYGMDAGFPRELLLTVIFEEHDGKTRLTLRHVGIPSGEQQVLARDGWNTSLDKLAELLKEMERVPA